MAKPRILLAEGGEISITRLADGSYAVDTIQHAAKSMARGCGIVRRNEAGFHGRQWEIESAAIGGHDHSGLWLTQHSTLAEAARAIGHVAHLEAQTRAIMRSSGIA